MLTLHGHFTVEPEEIYANTVMLISKVENLRERRRLEGKLKQLRDNLEQRRAQ